MITCLPGSSNAESLEEEMLPAPQKVSHSGNSCGQQHCEGLATDGTSREGLATDGASREMSATSPSTALDADISSSFEAILAEQLRRLQEVLTEQHKQEVTSVREHTSRLYARQERKKSRESVSELARTTSRKEPVPPAPEPSPPPMPSTLALPSIHSDMPLQLDSLFLSKQRHVDRIDSVEQYGSLHSRPSLRSTVEIHGDRERKDEVWPMTCLRCLMIHPHTMRRFFCDLFMGVLVWYDLLIIPLEVSALVRTSLYIELLMASVWTLDLFLNFFRGFEKNGVVELRIRKTALAYLRSWFMLDFSLVLLDWVMIVFTSLVAFASVLRSVKVLRLWRAARLLKFLRLYRMKDFSKLSMYFFRSELSRTMFKISTWIVGILMLNHVTACFWYMLGSLPLSSPTWTQTAIDNYMLSGKSEEPPTSTYLYLTALHWSVTQYTPASMEVVPRNSWERAYNLFTIFSSLVLFPPFLASIANSMAALRKTTAEYADARKNLVQFLQENRVSPNLSSRIESVVTKQHENLRKSKRLHEPAVSLLNLLPQSLKEQMHIELYQHIIVRHPLLGTIGSDHERTLIKLCDVAMCQESLQSGQELFAYGNEAEKVYFVVSGKLSYFEGPVPSPQNREEVMAGAIVCDQVMWMQWVHQGQMTAVQPCTLANLNGACFRNIIAQRPAVHALCCRFAESYFEDIQAEIRTGSYNDLGCSIPLLEDIAIAAGIDITYQRAMSPTPPGLMTPAGRLLPSHWITFW